MMDGTVLRCLAHCLAVSSTRLFLADKCLINVVDGTVVAPHRCRTVVFLHRCLFRGAEPAGVSWPSDRPHRDGSPEEGDGQVTAGSRMR